MGYADNDFSSLDLALERLEIHKPQAVVLAGLSSFDFDVYRKQAGAYMRPISVADKDNPIFIRRAMRKFYEDIKGTNPT